MPVLTALTVGMALLLPTTAAMSVTREREQGTLVLLALTPVSASSQVLQKFLSQLWLAGSLIILSLPLVAVGYAYGGVSAELIVLQLSFFLVLVTQLSAIGLAAGCLVSGTIGSILLANATAAMLLLPFALLDARELPTWLHASPLSMLIQPTSAPFMRQPQAPSLSMRSMEPPIALTLALLAIARVRIASRLEPSQASPLGRALRGMDAVCARIDARLFRRAQARELPVDRPVFWREANRASYCNWRYLVRMLLPVSACLVFLMISLVGVRSADAMGTAMVIAFIAGGLVVAMVSASVISRDRSDQTLDVLLSSGMTSAAMVAEKMRALARLRWALIACLLSGVWVCSFMPRNEFVNYAERLSSSALPGGFPLPQLIEITLCYGIVAWMSVLAGLALRTWHRAVMVSLVAALVWMSATHLLLQLDQRNGFRGYQLDESPLAEAPFSWLAPLAAMSPWDMLMERRDAAFSDLSTSAILSAWSIDAAIWMALRWACLAMARRSMSSANRANN